VTLHKEMYSPQRRKERKGINNYPGDFCVFAVNMGVYQRTRNNPAPAIL
jgi:hypothetical protein